MEILKQGEEAVQAYQNSEKGKKNAENEAYRVPVGTFIFGKFTQVKETINGKEQIYFVYPLLRNGEKVAQVSIPQIEKTAMWNIETSLVKKKGVEKYFLIPNALRPLLEVDKVKLEGKTVTISIAPEIGYKTEYVGTEGYATERAALDAWEGRKGKRTYDMAIS